MQIFGLKCMHSFRTEKKKFSWKSFKNHHFCEAAIPDEKQKH